MSYYEDEQQAILSGALSEDGEFDYDMLPDALTQMRADVCNDHTNKLRALLEADHDTD